METDELERGENEGNVDPLLMGDSEEEMEDELPEREFEEEEEEEEEWREIGDDLVPIRLELFLDGSTFKDTFTWDLTGNERMQSGVLNLKFTVRDFCDPGAICQDIMHGDGLPTTI